MAENGLIAWKRRLAQAHPVLATAIPLIAIGWIGMLTFISFGIEPSPAILILSAFFIVVMVGVNWLIGGWAEVRRVFGRLLKWRFNPILWVLVLFGAPAATILVAFVSGTFTPPADWGQWAINYFIQTVLIGALIVNLWEESVWGGMVQGRLMARHGLLIGSLLAAIPFALIHLPLAFGPPGFFGNPMSQVLVIWAVLIGTAPFFRYLMGMMLIETGGSTLAIGLMHASWNASSGIAGPGGWQYIGGLAVLIVVVAGWRLMRGQSLTQGHVPEVADNPQGAMAAAHAS
jgi:membrane protease YdiL (CAAX protease family)